MGDYLPPGSLKLPAGGIRSAHVVKYANYIQIHGRLDCAALNINCTMSAPGAYDDGGQYDDGAFKNCGKEPYSGVDSSDNGNAGMQHYVEMAGNGLYCMRVCAPGTMVQGGVCDVTQDTAGCIAFMGVQFTQEESFTYTDTLTGVTTTASVKLPPMKTSTTTTTTTTTTTVAVATGATTANGAIATGTSSTGGNKASDVSALVPSTGVLGLLGLLFGAVMV
ncbi:hypothetical protein BCR33DRAFT_495239 [Rhizoclosmatium globosum]|uniref:Uncharacterized protein n=1 Tax=Rhizoclosmatium globosum TaxID=329046 RepID=A0A1Y2CUS3_9FUNG|nr:hypothetical protein BCR33DRAFT_495239 [Rhizoclosmatium globosum]|eukprot:ORY50791.1 hypothetical protein BCR33DRAFT_495239 [Rhizoclosmatium globosum]